MTNYEQDDGPLTDDQIKQLKELKELPEDWEATSAPWPFDENDIYEGEEDIPEDILNRINDDNLYN
jgi:hypothetical protein